MRSFRSIRSLEPLQGTDRVVAGDHLEAPVRDVGERDEPVDPRRVGGEEAARPRRDRDRVAVVLAPAGRWEDDERRRRRTVAELDARLGRGSAAEQRALHLAGQERVEGALAGDGRACAGNREPDRPGGRIARGREGIDDDDRSGRRSREHERRDGRCEGAGHGGSLADRPRLRSLRRDDRRAVDGRALALERLRGGRRAGRRRGLRRQRRAARAAARDARAGAALADARPAHARPSRPRRARGAAHRALRDPGRDRLDRDGRPPDRGDPDPGALRRRRRLRRQRHALLLGRHALPRRRGRRPGGRRPRLGDGEAHAPRPRRARAAGAHRRDDDRPRVGAQPVRPLLARPRGGGRRALPRRRARRGRSSSPRRTTTARASSSSASTTAPSSSSALRA